MTDAAAPLDTSPVAEIPLRRRLGWWWLAAFGVALVLVLLLLHATVVLFVVGVGVWGTNIPYVWGFDLINYVWWIGIANAASLFAVILVMREHDLRTSVNRFAEGVALFAVICAGLYPILHLGRPWLFYWTFPYPATYEVWPQFRSPLTWDFWAISTHFIVTALFWYIGLIPDLATLRDRGRRLLTRRIYGVLALGWRGDMRHWSDHQTAYRIVAGLVIPLILVMQSCVAFEFAVTLVPDWHEIRLPVHFVVTGLASGLAMVLLIAVLLRASLGVDEFIDAGDIDLLAKLLLASALAAGYSYADEAFFALLDEPRTREAFLARIAAGSEAAVYWSGVLLVVGLPQLLWIRGLRRRALVLAAVAVAVNVGVWLDRYSIIVGGLARDHLPSAWRSYAPSLAEWGLLLGTVGLFAALLLLFVRYLPVIAMYEAKHADQETAR